ncbi:hypothetical protein LG634_17020 [Streptomyces bambusae]|uniref:hypothetical protein n=1 Tax=Streptomyces bambusae TaxID=1550616 RepID=UPI001CFEDC24|nr:hypothetical protein [Streptomyces bambusae]MCB5166535.1 hypothetical protein [Streptomyces bambusae]
MDYERKAWRARMRLIGVGVAGLAIGAAVAVGVVSLAEDDGPAAAADGEATPAASAPGTPGAGPGRNFTPETARRVSVLKPTVHTEGIGRGFEHSSLGALSAAVSYWQDLSFLDGALASRQWKAITSKDSPGTVDRAVSKVRKIRETAGLPPAGGSPDGITFTTSVEAVYARSLDETGEILDVWLHYDRYGVVRGEGADDDPLKDQTTNLILKWEDGDWKVTEEEKYTRKSVLLVPYSPDSKDSFQLGWRKVSHG